ncbi:hypothetical protein ACLOJK_029594 [Asimina triloba]
MGNSCGFHRGSIARNRKNGAPRKRLGRGAKSRHKDIEASCRGLRRGVRWRETEAYRSTVKIWEKNRRRQESKLRKETCRSRFRACFSLPLGCDASNESRRPIASSNRAIVFRLEQRRMDSDQEVTLAFHSTAAAEPMLLEAVGERSWASTMVANLAHDPQGRENGDGCSGAANRQMPCGLGRRRKW